MKKVKNKIRARIHAQGLMGSASRRHKSAKDFDRAKRNNWRSEL